MPKSQKPQPTRRGFTGVLLSVIIIIILGYILLFQLSADSGSSLIRVLIVTQLLIIGTLVLAAVVYGQLNKSNDNHALGLPPGSIRAFISLVLISSFAVIAIFLFEQLNSPGPVQSSLGLNTEELASLKARLPAESIISIEDRSQYEAWDTSGGGARFLGFYNKFQLDSLIYEGQADSSALAQERYDVHYFQPRNADASDLAKQILTILATLVVAVSAFYFGSKATEQGGKIAREVFQDAKKEELPGSNNDVPEQVVAEAVTMNRQKWMEQYGALDVLVGKKQKDGVNSARNCIQFVVASKEDYEVCIDKFLPYEHEGKVYQIPTDVVETSGSSETPVTNTVTNESDNQEALIIEYITTKGEALRAEFPEITGLSYQQQEHNEVPTGKYVLVIQVVKKQVSPPKALPQQIKFKGRFIEVDVQERSKTTAKLDLDSSVSRTNDSEFGMIGVPVTKSGKKYIMGCYHVYFNNLVAAGKLFASAASENIQVLDTDRPAARRWARQLKEELINGSMSLSVNWTQGLK